MRNDVARTQTDRTRRRRGEVSLFVFAGWRRKWKCMASWNL